MDFFELGCRSLETPYLNTFMDAAGLLGRGFTVPLIGAALWIYGHYRKNAKAKDLGLAVLVSLLVSAIAVNAIKLVLQLPRPTPRTGYGFPSGDSGTAFSFAAVVGVAFPTSAPWVFLLATLASISRLYFRAHYVWDVVGGALIGLASGAYFARTRLAAQPALTASWSARVIWPAIGVIAAASAVFFLRLEGNIARHRVGDDFSLSSIAPAAVIDFGADSARPYLSNGWSTNTTWRQPAASINWVEGRDASLNVALVQGQDYRARFRAYPYRPAGFTCQTIAIKLNDQPVQRVYLEQDWNAYEVLLLKQLVKTGTNRVGLHFAYADTANWHGINPGRKPLSVAFDIMQFIPEP